MRIWFPTIKTNSGSDQFVKRLSNALENQGVYTYITWFPHWRELLPFLVTRPTPLDNTDIIHVNSWHGFSFYQNNIPLLTTCHHCVHDSAYKPYTSLIQRIYHDALVYKFERNTFLLSKAINCVSEYTSNIVTTKFPGINPITIHNGIDIEFFKPANTVFTNRKFRIFYAGNLTQRKGVDLLPQIMDKLDNNFELRYSTGLSKKNLSFGPNCVNLGYLKDYELLEEYQQCDVVLYPSKYEGFGYVACEAMACGKPVVTTKCSALSELVRDHVNGFLCNPGDANSFAIAIQTLADSKSLREKLGDAGRKRVEENYTQEIMAKKYIDLYSNIINKSG